MTPEEELIEEVDSLTSYAGELEREVVRLQARERELERKVLQMTYEAGVLYRALDPYGLRSQ